MCVVCAAVNDLMGLVFNDFSHSVGVPNSLPEGTEEITKKRVSWMHAFVLFHCTNAVIWLHISPVFLWSPPIDGCIDFASTIWYAEKNFVEKPHRKKNDP